MGLADHEPLIASLVRLDRAGGRLRRQRLLSVAGGGRGRAGHAWLDHVAAERARLEKDRAAAEKERPQQCGAKLGNTAFTDKALDAWWRRSAAARHRQSDLDRIDEALRALAG